VDITVGQIWKSSLGGKPFMVVGFDANLVLVKGADESKKNLAVARGGRLMARSEFADCRLIEDAPAMREP
jgi:hypothetical protein